MKVGEKRENKREGLEADDEVRQSGEKIQVVWRRLWLRAAEDSVTGNLIVLNGFKQVIILPLDM